MCCHLFVNEYYASYEEFMVTLFLIKIDGGVSFVIDPYSSLRSVWWMMWETNRLFKISLSLIRVFERFYKLLVLYHVLVQNATDCSYHTQIHLHILYLCHAGGFK